MTLYDKVSFVKRGKNRFKVFMALDKPMMPLELVLKIYGSNSNTNFNLVSRALKELRENSIVKVINPNSKTGRVYMKTNLGSKLLKKI